MVRAATIKQSNARYASEHHTGLVCVFAGATSEIGAGTLAATVRILDAPTIYVLGQSASRFASQRAKLEILNPRCKIVFLEYQISLLSGVDMACKQITAAEKKVDLLYMSSGMLPLNGPQFKYVMVLNVQKVTATIDTKEGLDTCFAISYYSRMRLLSNILPLLRQSPQPRVLSVLNAGREHKMQDDDIGLEQHWSMLGVVFHTTTMMSLALEYLAENDKRIAFLHSHPGAVKTDIFARLTAPEPSSLAWKFFLPLLKVVVAVAFQIFGTSPEISGERQAFHLTSDTYGPGAVLIDSSSNQVSPPAVLEKYREPGGPQRVWDYTIGVFEKALANYTESLSN